LPAHRDPTWRPRTADYAAVIAEQNPWQLDGKVPDDLAFEVERPLARGLWKRVLSDEPHRFQLILGPRRVGKTTVMYQTVRRLIAEGLSPRRLWWLRLDHPLLMDQSFGDLVRLVIESSGASREKPAVLLLDELTYARDWPLWLKTLYDERWPVRIVATSSSTSALRQAGAESGVGRWEEQYLAPYTFLEFLELIEAPVTCPELGETLADTLDAWIENSAALDAAQLRSWRKLFLLIGGYPELLALLKQPGEAEAPLLRLFQNAQRVVRRDAVETPIYKDITQAFGIQKPMALERLLYILAGQFTGVMSPKSICRSLEGLSEPTFSRYLKALESAFLVFSIPNYSASEETVQRRGRKLYFVDGAVRNAALQRGVAPLESPQEMGVLIENLVAGHLHAMSRETSTRLYYWRDSSKREVDLVLDDHAAPMAFEVTVDEDHGFRNMAAFIERYPRFRERTYMVTTSSRLTFESARGSRTSIGVVPLELMLLAVGAHTSRAMTDHLR